MTNELYEKHCWALVDLDAMQSNLALIQKTVGAPVCCVVKADAYGHGAAVAGPWLEENFPVKMQALPFRTSGRHSVPPGTDILLPFLWRHQ